MKKFAERLKNLGTETAFAVSAEAKAFADAGNKVYPFHLGDMNIKTPENIIEAAKKAMDAGKTGYCSNYGIIELQEAMANEINNTHNTSYTAKNVAVQPGGKPTISKFILSLMDPGDEVLYPNPGYPIYESQIEFHGGKAVPYTFIEGKNGFELDVDSIEKMITEKTKIMIFNNLQNPTGAESSSEELKRIADLINKYDLYILADEAYWDIRYEGKSESIVSFPGIAERAVILYTFSKKFAMTGWRLGASIGPENLINTIAKINVNDESCSNHFIQYAAVECLQGDQSGAEKIVQTLKERRNTAVEMLNSIDGIQCFKPHATFYLWPNVTKLMENLNISDYDQFRQKMLKETGVSFCTRTHFGKVLPDETEKYIRFAYSGIDVDEIKSGLELFKKYIESI